MRTMSAWSSIRRAGRRAAIGFGAAGMAALFAPACENTVIVVPCEEGEVDCGEGCTSLGADPDHCGACDNACGEGEVCRSGACTGGECPPNSTSCGGACVDTETDPAHCGACFDPCRPGEFCVGGSCQSDCPAPLTACGASCVDTQTDPLHCGGCFAPCGDEETCEGGKCSTSMCPGSTCGICDVVTLPSLGDQTFVGSTFGAEHDFVPSCVGTAAPEVLHTFTAPVDGLYTFDTLGSNYDTILSLLGPNGCFESLCNDDTIGLASQIQTLIPAGNTVHLVVDGFTAGNYVLNVSLEPVCPPGEMLCGNACVDVLTSEEHCGGCFSPCDLGQTCAMGMCTGGCTGPCGTCGVVVPLSSTVPQTLTSSTASAFDDLSPSCAVSSAPEVLHEFTAPFTGSFVFSTQNSSYDTVLSLLDPSSCSELACNDDFGPALTSRIQTTLTQGQTVYVSVDGNGASGPYSLFVNGTQSSTCPHADLGDTLPVTVTGNTAGAANMFTPPNGCAFSQASDHAYTFTAPVTKVYTIDTFGSAYDTVLNVLSATCAGVSLACNDDFFNLQSQVDVSLTAGQVVTIVVDGFGSSNGGYVLNVQ